LSREKREISKEKRRRNGKVRLLSWGGQEEGGRKKNGEGGADTNR